MGALSDSSRNHIIPLDFASVQTVPESHVWSESDDEYRCPPGVRSGTADPCLSVPVINLWDPNASELIFEACEKWGVFQLTGHGIPAKLMEEVESKTQRLFSLPVDQKLKVLRSPGGGTGYGRAVISPFFPKHMWHEGFTIRGPPADHAKQLWPHDFEEFCETMDDYQKQMKALIEQLIHIILKSLNINPQQLNWLKSHCSGHETSTTPGTALQLNSYPPCPNPNRTMGLAQHTDTSLITILQAQTSGLQIFRDDVGWISVQPVRGALTVNIGDFLHVLSNGRIVSVLHRVVVNPVQRFSVAYFYAPPSDFVVSPLLSKALGDSGQGTVARYRTVTAKEFIDMKGKHLDRALSLIKT
ncbi:putative gibberellin 3-beta-dioxygenase [Rosa chinensis]|uniref:gibberellin 3beta-dioxygenase n=1 Tax=Rosa chinensis TaxID=74649 RepID=A0A2P6Q1V1_ROSCH|nr:gibberellin 3-beta-dioxygenase 1 [Rosa chinensis]PRQ28147.1 putative gibberellin 3-beta-dioxygenase [Rosa chinensis]